MTVRAGLIGPGWVAQDRHLPVLAALAPVQLVALCDTDERRCQEVADRFAVPGRFRELDDFLAQDLDLVCIATPPPTHAELAGAALAAGAHVFLEKPMALHLADAQRMVDQAREHRRLLCVSHNFIHSRSARRADQLLRGDQVRYAMATQLSSEGRRLPTWYRDLPGGLMLDESPHLLYALQHYLGGPLQLEHVRAETDPATGQPALVELAVRGAKGPGQVTMVFDSPVSEWHIGLVAGRRVVDIDLFRDICVSVRSDRAHKASDILRSSATAVGGHVAGFVRSGALWSRQKLFWGHDELLRRFVEAIEHGGESPVRYEDALNIVAVTDQILAELGAGTP